MRTDNQSKTSCCGCPINQIHSRVGIATLLDPIRACNEDQLIPLNTINAAEDLEPGTKPPELEHTHTHQTHYRDTDLENANYHTNQNSIDVEPLCKCLGRGNGNGLATNHSSLAG